MVQLKNIGALKNNPFFFFLKYLKWLLYKIMKYFSFCFYLLKYNGPAGNMQMNS